jgi:hypothetical protein
MTKQEKKREKGEAKTGPEADRLKLAGDWKGNVKHALAKKKPKGGWPKV